MFLRFFEDLRGEGIPVSLREYLVFLEALDLDLASCSLDTLYYLARSMLVKKTQHYDRFDLVFARQMKGRGESLEEMEWNIPRAWLEEIRETLLRSGHEGPHSELSPEELLEKLQRLLKEQDGAHHGGSRWVGTQGRSAFGHSGTHRGGIRIQGNRGFGQAIKVWERRRHRGLNGSAPMQRRHLKVALRALRRWGREGRPEEFDLDATIRATARSGGLLDLRWRPPRKNRLRVIMLFDVGGSMEPHVELCEELFGAARSELEHLVWYDFHNCPYEALWRHNRRGKEELIPTEEILLRHGPEHRLIVVGDAAMHPFELNEVGGSRDHWNERPGSYWLKRIFDHFPHSVWLNPTRECDWPFTATTRQVLEICGKRMFPLTVDGLRRAFRAVEGAQASQARD